MQTQQPLWNAVVQYLRLVGVDVLFGIPADDLGVLVAAQDQSVRMIIAKDQRNALFMAAGYALVGKRLGVCVVGKGPALTNTITGLLEGASLSAPLLLIGVGTGRDRIGTNSFQEADQVALAKPTVKWAYRVESESRLVWALQRAAFLATNGCPGPIYIELPEDLTHAPSAEQHFSAPAPLGTVPSRPELDAALEMLRSANRPLLLVGGGALNTRFNQGAIEAFADLIGGVIFTTASGRGAVDERHSLFGGVAGLYTSVVLRTLWNEADAIVVLGSRLEETATLLMNGSAHNRPVIQINICVDHFSHIYGGLKLLGDCGAAVQYWSDALSRGPQRNSSCWTRRIDNLKQYAVRQRDELLQKLELSPRLHIAQVLAGIEATLPEDAVIVQENGLLDMWSYFYPYFSLKPGQRSLVPSEQTSLGFGAAAAVGVKVACPNRTVIALVGDGAFNLFRSDLATAIDHHIPITYVILKNGSFGWLEYQWRCQGKNTPQFRFSWDAPTFNNSIVRMEVSRKAELGDALRNAYRHNCAGKLAIVEVEISELEIAPGVGDFYGILTVADEAV